MIAVENAFKLIEENTAIGEIEIINASDAFGRILRENVYSAVNLPPFRASVKDGYAVMDTDGKGRREIIGRSDAGSAVNYLFKNCLQSFIDNFEQRIEDNFVNYNLTKNMFSF